MSNQLKADFLLVLVTLLAAMGWMFSKEALVGLTPLLFMGIRFVLAGSVLCVIGAQQIRGLDKEAFWRACFVGLVFSVAMVFWIHGLAYGTHIGVGAFLTSLGVVLVPLVTLLFGERPAPSIWAALPLAAIGLGFLSLDEAHPMGWGEVSYVLAAVSFAFYFTLNSRAASRVPIIALSAIQLVVVGCVAFMVSAMTEEWNFNQPTDIWLWVLASVFIGTSLRFFMQTWAQGLASASNAAIIMTLEPIWTALLAILWFGEGASGVQVIGFVLIFGALMVSRSSVLLSVWSKWRKKAKPA